MTLTGKPSLAGSSFAPGRGLTPIFGRRSRGVLALVLLLAAVSVPVTPTAALAKGCYAYELLDYNHGRLYAQYLIDLPACWSGKGDYKVKAKIVRQVGADTTIVKKVKTCSPDDLSDSSRYGS